MNNGRIDKNLQALKVIKFKISILSIHIESIKVNTLTFIWGFHRHFFLVWVILLSKSRGSSLSSHTSAFPTSAPS